MDKRIKVVVFGTSTGTDEVLKMLNEKKINILAYLDNDTIKQGTAFKNKKIIAPSDIIKFDFDYVILGSFSFEEEMINQLIKEGVLPSIILNPLSKLGARKKKHIVHKYNEYLLYREMFEGFAINTMFNDYAFCSMNPKSAEKRLVSLYDYPDYLLTGIDYVRVSTVELLAREIISKRIEGAVAELGVYRGNFTKLLSMLFSSRRLYLFDTFEGFSERDIENEQKRGFSKARKGHLGDTNINLVIDKIQSDQDVIVRKGYFPETTKDLGEDQYAFVSIDVDLYKPTYDGLNYFYDRLSKGGYIIIHDYNFDTYKGVKEAVQQFCKEQQISYVPMSDYFGSVIITK